MGDEFRHITRILSTVANFWTNGDLGQTAITSDENLIYYKNSDNTRMYQQVSNRYTTNGSTYTYLDVEFNDVTAQGDLITSSRVERDGESDTRLELNSDQINTVAGGVTALTVEDDVVYTGVNNIGVGSNVNSSLWPTNYNVIDFELQGTYSPKIVATSAGEFYVINNAYRDNSAAQWEKESSSTYVNSIRSNVSGMEIFSTSLAGAAGTAIDFGASTVNKFLVDSTIGTYVNVEAGNHNFQVNSETSGVTMFCDVSEGRTIFGNNITPASLVELYDTDAHPILTITAAHATDYDPQIQFRTDASPTVKASHGIDSANDAYVVQMGTGGVGGGTNFVIASNGKIGIGTNTPTNELEVSGGTGECVLELFSNASGESQGLLFTDDKDGTPIYGVCGLHTDNTLRLGTEGTFATTQFIIDTDGDIGVGKTPAVGDKVDIAGNIVVSAADGDRDNDWVAEFTNNEATVDRNFCARFQGGSSANDDALLVVDHDAANTLLELQGNGYLYLPKINQRSSHVTNNEPLYLDRDTGEIYGYSPP